MYEIAFNKYAVEELRQLDGSLKKQVLAAIKKVSQAPQSYLEGGYGKPLGGNLTGLFKIKLLKANIRIVYSINRFQNRIDVIVINKRSDNTCYELASERLSE